jgi:hypothetical protein
MNDFDHEKLDVCVAAIDFVALADEVVEHLPRGRAYLADQLQRAATSFSPPLLSMSVDGSVSLTMPGIRPVVSSYFTSWRCSFRWSSVSETRARARARARARKEVPNEIGS